VQNEERIAPEQARAVGTQRQILPDADFGIAFDGLAGVGVAPTAQHHSLLAQNAFVGALT